MFSILNSRLLQRAFLMRLLQTTGLSLALMTASAAGVHAEDVTVQGADGANGEDGVNPGDDGQSGGGGGAAVANAGGIDPIASTLNTATAFGGGGGKGGDLFVNRGAAGFGGPGGAARATAATTIISGSSEADATSTGGSGGSSGFAFVTSPVFFANGGQGGAATASATASTGGGNVTASALATGGNGGVGDGGGGGGGDASASSTARTTGSGGALSSANATGGEAGGGFDIPGLAGNATAGADASAAGGGKAIATAVATVGFGELVEPVAKATSNAVTANGAMAQALSTAAVQTPFPGSGPFVGQASSTAKTSFEGVSAQSSEMNTSSFGSGSTTTAEAIAQGGSGAFDLSAAIATALPDKVYATTLIGGASNVADALLGRRDEIFGTADQLAGAATSTFDFRFQGDLLLGVIEGFDFDIIVNGAPIFTGGSVTDGVINLGSNFGPNIDLTIEGNGTFAIGGVVPETSTWAMLLLGFAGLGLVGYRQMRGPSRRRHEAHRA